MSSDAIELRTSLKQQGVNLSDESLTKLSQFASLLLRANRYVNLISRNDEENIYRRHILHSLSPLWTVALPDNLNVLDLGTGGGLPGIPLSIVMPQSNFVLIDSTAKKIDAVNNIIADLELPNVRAVWGRAEELGKSRDLEHAFHVVLARAVAPLDELIRYARPFFIQKETLEKERSRPERPNPKRPDVQPPALIAFKGGELEPELKKARRSESIAKLLWVPIIYHGIDETERGDKKIVIVEMK